MNKLLLIVDPQNDFIDGSLPVPRAAEAMDALAEYVMAHGNEYDRIIVTLDFHPVGHSSFTENGGEWPRHCVAHSVGAAIRPALLEALMPFNPLFVTKGTLVDKDEYSVFENRISAPLVISEIVTLHIDHIDVCGLAGDICVRNTFKDICRLFPEVTTTILTEFSPTLE